MKTLISFSICVLLSTGAYAQRGGGGRGGGGFGGGMRGGGGFGGGMRGGGFGGGMRGGGFGGGGFRGGFIGGGRGNFIGGGRGFIGKGFIGRGVGFRSFGVGFGGLGWGWGGGWGWPWWGGGGYWPGLWDSGYGYGYGAGSPYPLYDSSASPNVTVVYPQAAAQPTTNTVVVERARPVTRTYDEYGQERADTDRAAGPPIYLVAFQDRSIRAVLAYWVEGKNLIYVTLDHQQKTVPLDTVDRNLSLQLNRERRMPFQLP